METATNEQPTPAPEAIKQQLEIDKLNAEIRELNKSWYKKPVYLAAMLPAFVAIVSVIILYLNGNFEVKNKELQVRKEALDLDIRKFEIKKDSLAKEIKRSEDTIQIYKNERTVLRKENEHLDTMLQFANDTLREFRLNTVSLNNAIAKLKTQIKLQGNNQQAEKNVKDLENISKKYNEDFTSLRGLLFSDKKSSLKAKERIFELENQLEEAKARQYNLEKVMDSLLKRN
jgi:chromosome segregation ATPase